MTDRRAEMHAIDGANGEQRTSNKFNHRLPQSATPASASALLSIIPYACELFGRADKASGLAGRAHDRFDVMQQNPLRLPHHEKLRPHCRQSDTSMSADLLFCGRAIDPLAVHREPMLHGREGTTFSPFALQPARSSVSVAIASISGTI